MEGDLDGVEGDEGGRVLVEPEIIMYISGS